MKFSFFSQVQHQFQPASVRYRQLLAEIVHAESLGYTNAWVSSMHFQGDVSGGLPSPLVLLAAASQRTDRIGLGTAVVALAHEQGVRIAEDAAVLDTLSGGRVRLGYSSGGTDETLEPFGVRVDERHVRGERELDRLRAALSGTELGVRGQRLFPLPDGLGERLWRAALDAATARRAGESGDGIFLSTWQPRADPDDRRELWDYQDPIIDAYVAGLVQRTDVTGVQTAPRIAASRTVLVYDRRSRDRVERQVDRGLAAFARRRWNPLWGQPTRERLIEEAHAVVGTPDEVLAQLRKDTALVRVSEIATQVHLVDPAHEDTLRSLELFATEVVPHL